VIELGTEVKDTITAFQGIVTSCQTFMHGYPIVRVEAFKRKDNGDALEAWFNELRLEVIVSTDQNIIGFHTDAAKKKEHGHGEE